MSSPLRLERSFFTRVQIVADEKYAEARKNNPNPLDVNLSIEVGIGRPDEAEAPYNITVKVAELTPTSGVLPYKIEVEAFGVFSVVSGFVHPELEKIVGVNGASMLYSSMREYVSLLTGRGPYGSYQLPTVNMQDVLQEGSKNTSPLPPRKKTNRKRGKSAIAPSTPKKKG